MTGSAPPKALSLQWKLPLLVGSLLLLLSGGAVVGAWAVVRQAVLAAARERLATVSAEFGNGLDAQVQGYLAAAEAAAAHPEVRRALEAGGEDALAPLADVLLGPRVIAAELLTHDGRVVWAGGGSRDAVRALEGQHLRDSSYGGPTRGVGRLLALGDTLTFPVVVVVRHGEERLGYLARWIAVPPDPRMPAAVSSLVGLGARVYIGSPGGAWSDQSAVTSPPPVAAESLGTMRIYDRPERGHQLAVGASVPGAPWMVVTEFPLATILAPASSFLRRAVLGMALLLVAGTLIGARATRRITSPLRHLTTAADRMAAGGHAVRVDVQGADELGRLGAAFNEMAQRVDVEILARETAEAQWRLLFRANPFPMWVFDETTLRFLAVNDAAVARYGWSQEEFLAMTIAEIRPSEDVARLVDAIVVRDAMAATVGEWQHCDRAGEVFMVEVTSTAVEFDAAAARLVMVHDVSARRALEQQLRQAQKMEAVGRLAGGVAHDFNNSLAVISACAELTVADLRSAGQTTEHLDEILRATGQARALTRQLLTFSRQQVTRPEVLDPTPVVEAVVRMVSRLVEEDVRIIARLEEHLGRVRIDPVQLEQVMLNLVVNARDAITTQGAITVATTVRDVDAAVASGQGLPGPGPYVVLSVSDNGTGIPPEILPRLFEPFFTTKPVGEGTGLGLATAYGIVSAAGGGITVYSEVGVGSTFRVYLPLILDASAPRATPPHSTPLPRSAGGEVVLLVEDDVAVRTVTAAVLERLGYVVLAAEAPDAALALVADPDTVVHLVLSDVVMPGMSGPALVQRLRAARPELRTILMSGYAGDAVASRGVEASGLPFLEKPFTLAALAAALRAELDAPGAPTRSD